MSPCLLWTNSSIRQRIPTLGSLSTSSKLPNSELGLWGNSGESEQDPYVCLFVLLTSGFCGLGSGFCCIWASAAVSLVKATKAEFLDRGMRRSEAQHKWASVLLDFRLPVLSSLELYLPLAASHLTSFPGLALGSSPVPCSPRGIMLFTIVCPPLSPICSCLPVYLLGVCVCGVSLSGFKDHALPQRDGRLRLSLWELW